MQLVDLHLLSETLRVRRLLWLRQKLFWERKNTPALTVLGGLHGALSMKRRASHHS